MFSRENAHSLRDGSEMLGLIGEISRMAMSSWQPISSEILGFRYPSGAGSAFPRPEWPPSILARAPGILRMGPPAHGKRENRWPRLAPCHYGCGGQGSSRWGAPCAGACPLGPRGDGLWVLRRDPIGPAPFTLLFCNGECPEKPCLSGIAEILIIGANNYYNNEYAL